MVDTVDRGVIIAIASRKGGVGKSTLTINLGAEFARQGYNVSLVDADKQKTVSKWFDRREHSIEEGEDWPVVRCIEKSGRVRNTLIEESTNKDIVIVDPAGRDSAELRGALLAADIVYIPTQVSQYDLETLDEMVDIIEETAEGNEHRTVRAVVTQAPVTPGAKETQEAREFLKEFDQHMTLSDVIIRSRKSYRVSPRNGASVIEWNDSKAKAEIQLLAQEIINHAKQ